MTSWLSEIILPGKPDNLEYAYIQKEQSEYVECNEATLLEMLENDDNIKFVTTPAHNTFIIPGSDYFTLLPLLKKRKAKATQKIRRSLFLISIIVGIMILFLADSESDTGFQTVAKLILLIFGIVPLLDGVYNYFALKKIDENNFEHEALSIKFYFWVGQKKIIFLEIIAAILFLLTLFQIVTGLDKSIELAGLVKSATIHGEYWRILTGPLLHAGIIHIVFNMGVLLTIGYIVIRITDLYMFSIVLLFSTILGSVFSIYFLPETTSVGISGGIMGLIGFLLIISIKQKELIPNTLLKSMVATIILMTVLGISLSDIIDNAGHGGGLIGGLLLGFLLIESKKQAIPYTSGFMLKIAGLLSLIILLGGVIFTVTRIYYTVS